MKSSLPYFCVVGAVISSCSRHVFSPPARMAPVESVAIVSGDHVNAAVEGGLHGAVFGPTLTSATVRARRAFSRDAEAVFEGSASYVTNASDSDSDAHPVIYALRTGVKGRLGEFFALTGGMGIGLSAGGGFVAPDLGAVFAYENLYVVPFVAGRTYLSLPFAQRVVDLGEDDASMGTRFSGSPRRTFGLQISAGTRVPLTRDPDDGAALLFALGITNMRDSEDNETFMSLTVGAETNF